MDFQGCSPYQGSGQNFKALAWAFFYLFYKASSESWEFLSFVCGPELAMGTMVSEYLDTARARGLKES